MYATLVNAKPEKLRHEINKNWHGSSHVIAWAARHHVLHQAHVHFAELAGFACLIMIHPVPYDMGMAVRFPCGVVARYAVMTFVLMNEDLQGCDSPSLMAAVTILPKLVYGCVLFAHHHALTKRRTASLDLITRIKNDPELCHLIREEEE